MVWMEIHASRHPPDRQATQLPTRRRVGSTSLNEPEHHRKEAGAAGAEENPLGSSARGVLGAGDPRRSHGIGRRQLTQTQTTNTSAAICEAHSTATAHDAPFARTSAAAAAPTTTPTVTRLAARPK
jgi:hypothetical protein